MDLFEKSLLEKRTEPVKKLQLKAEKELKAYVGYEEEEQMLDPAESVRFKEEGNDLLRNGY